MKTYKGLIIPEGTNKKYVANAIKKFGIDCVKCETLHERGNDSSRCRGFSCNTCILYCDYSSKSRSTLLDWIKPNGNWIPKNGDRVWCLIITDKVTYYDDIYNEKTHKSLFNNGLIFKTRKQVRSIVNEIKNIL